MFRPAESPSPIRRASSSRWSRPTPAGFDGCGSATSRNDRRPRMAERPLSASSVAMRVGAAVPGSSVRAGRFGAWLDRQSPWRARAIAFLLGALGAAALPPVYAVPVLAVSFSGLVLLVDRTPRPIGAVALGWCFAFGYFVAGIYWVANALLSVSSAFGWLLPFAIV